MRDEKKGEGGEKKRPGKAFIAIYIYILLLLITDVHFDDEQSHDQSVAVNNLEMFRVPVAVV